MQALPIGPLSSKINLSVHSSLPALLTVLALVLTPQEPATPYWHYRSILQTAILSFPQAHGAIPAPQEGRDIAVCHICVLSTLLAKHRGDKLQCVLALLKHWDCRHCQVYTTLLTLTTFFPQQTW